MDFAVHHAESIIQWVFLIILLISGWLVGRYLFGKRAGHAGEESSNPELTAAIKQILDQTAKLESISVGGLTGDAGAFEAQLRLLKSDLAAREAELAKLQAGGGKLGEDAAGVNARIQELEAKLAEYEILEDDIADLSLYKEENQRLRGEVERLKVSGGSAAAGTSDPVVAAPAVEPVALAISEPAEEIAEEPTETVAEEAAPEPAGEDDILAEFAEAVGQQDAAVKGPATLAVPDTGNPMADFESAVKVEKREEVLKSAAAPEATADAGPQAEADDLFAEFSGAEDGGASLDTDKMMAEMAALVSVDPAGDPGLEESIDTDKMAAEADTLFKS